ncbi:MAG: peptide deformylase [Candidatus Yonathbacteria bacterium CG_4_10_14_3_um_filter_47_65]|uniref:Peptide deformylase n=2 Tax=Parcubacteria group TaxID=1794811 RepID=A0A2M8D9E3_9BACT|nr:MAG: peptide deformylase [Candidatus Nomurabacteria bacterium CG1_02_47_685]PIP03952.1 MAG: peptide deformylase [Candidatus Yonathbacteria bacterium CG23_combo_of_CG06-09_8_20_14_all_46_18]PIQ33241.1 MAG: peptide deformylase [Candidatus Yonathbacteria bacterium CG17_big_fil_post_rev_8_21_14_2_50_46_19]PIX56567.1 MAG: peptide deformylase [Candidatus Yonathbacteria bacterium CG_4_10_14_3_um_filter_47_65]PIY57436.1 MAG: peptide deformylase [Candidatus Yonathbacteria bacterium CG_4_10_14_0_8_um_
MVEIVQKENSILRKATEEVPLGDITGAQIKKTLADMKEALDSQDDGVAIAAPQIGVSLRIFIVSRKVFTMKEKDNEIEKSKTKNATGNNLVCINPVITGTSKKQLWLDEGCLSVRWLYGKVKRAEKATIRAYNEYGKLFTHGGSGLLAQIFQHETDHLNGILFIDKAKDIEEIKPENIQD